MPEIVPPMTQALGNARQAVKDSAAAAMTACMNTGAFPCSFARFEVLCEKWRPRPNPGKTIGATCDDFTQVASPSTRIHEGLWSRGMALPSHGRNRGFDSLQLQFFSVPPHHPLLCPPQ